MNRKLPLRFLSFPKNTKINKGSRESPRQYIKHELVASDRRDFQALGGGVQAATQSCLANFGPRCGWLLFVDEITVS